MSHYFELILQFDEVLGIQAALQLHWQYRARTQPSLLERVLAEVKMLKQESRITKTPAAAAEHLWKEFGGREREGVVEKSL